jgi:hypothetical protein
MLLATVAASLATAAAGSGGRRDNSQVLFYSSVTFLLNITQIEHKIPILNNALSGFIQ